MKCLLGPLGSTALDQHLPLAVIAARKLDEPLSLAVVRATPVGRRGRDRLIDALRLTPGFVYEFQPDCFALLMPGADELDVADAVLALRTRARGPILSSGAVIDAGIALHGHDMSATELFDAAALALDRAEAHGGGIALARPATQQPSLVG